MHYQHAKHLLLISCVSLALAACQHETPETPIPTTPASSHNGQCWVASFSGADQITLEHLYWLLKSHGIDSGGAGSIFYGVSVPVGRYSQAIKVIQDDLKERQYNITLHVGKKGVEYTVPDSNWRTVAENIPYADLIKRPDYAALTDLHAVFNSREMVQDLPTYPYVVSIKSLERSYMGSDYTWQTGHEFEIELSVNRDQDISRTCSAYQVWEHGKKVSFLGKH